MTSHATLRSVLTGLALPLLVLAFVLGLAPARAFAQDSSVEEARKHFDRGQTLYSVEKYDEAAEEFKKAYESKSFPAFLYNVAVSYEKAKKFELAVEYFKKYLEKSPQAQDKAEITKRITVIEEELQRIKDEANKPAPDPNAPTDPDAPPPTPAAPSKLEVLPEAKTKGLVIIESKPEGASIYIDDKSKGPVGETPWNGTLDGEHTVIIEAKGYVSEKKRITPSADKLLWIYVSLSRDEALGWLEVTANIPGADVYIDSKDVGAVGRTPFRGNVEKGKHKIIVSRAGYKDVVQETEIVAGKVHKMSVKLVTADVGQVQVRGQTSYGAKVKLDGAVVCEKVPCEFEAPIGEHALVITKSGKKTLKKKLILEKLTETQIKAELAPTPGRADAYWSFFFAAAFGTGAYFTYDYGVDNVKEGDELIDMGQIDDGESKRDRGQNVKYISYGVGALAGLVLVRGVYFLFRDKGPPSTAVITTRDIAFTPVVTPDGGGFLNASVRF